MFVLAACPVWELATLTYRALNLGTEPIPNVTNLLTSPCRARTTEIGRFHPKSTDLSILPHFNPADILFNTSVVQGNIFDATSLILFFIYLIFISSVNQHSMV